VQLANLNSADIKISSFTQHLQTSVQRCRSEQLTERMSCVALMKIAL